MTSSDPQQPGDGTYDPTVIRPAESNPLSPDLTKREASETPAGEQPVGGDSDAATTVHNTATPNPYAPPADPYAAPANPYAAPSDPYAQPNPYAAPADPYGANPYAAPPQYPGQQFGQQEYPGQQQYPGQQGFAGQQPAFPAYPGQQPGYPAYPGQVGGYPGYPAQQVPTGTNGLAIASLATSIIAIPLMCIPYLGIICVPAAIAGIIMGIIAMKQTKRTGQQGYGLALGGTIVGAVFLVLFVVLLIIGIGVLASGGLDTSSLLTLPF